MITLYHRQLKYYHTGQFSGASYRHEIKRAQSGVGDWRMQQKIWYRKVGYDTLTGYWHQSTGTSN